MKGLAKGSHMGVHKARRSDGGGTMTNREEIVGSVGVWPLKLLAKRWVCSDEAIRGR